MTSGLASEACDLKEIVDPFLFSKTQTSSLCQAVDVLVPERDTEPKTLDLKATKNADALKIQFHGLTFAGPFSLHPKIKQILAQTQKWAEKFAVFQRMDENEKKSRCLLVGGSFFASMSCWDMPIAVAQWQSDIFTFHFLFDDIIDNCNDLNKAKYLTNGFVEILFGENEKVVNELEKDELWAPAVDCRNRCPLNYDQLIAMKMEARRCCEAAYRICEWQINGILPDVETYLNERCYDSVIYYTVLLGILLHNYPNYRQEDWDVEDLSLLKLHAGRYVGIALDVLLIHKEDGYWERRLDVNIVALVRHNNNCSWEAAFDILHGLLDNSERITREENARLEGKYPEICTQLMNTVYSCTDFLLRERASRYK